MPGYQVIRVSPLALKISVRLYFSEAHAHLIAEKVHSDMLAGWQVGRLGWHFETLKDLRCSTLLGIRNSYRLSVRPN